MTIPLSNRVRWVLALVLLVAAVGGAYGWVAAQDRAYEREWDRAIDQHFRTDPGHGGSTSPARQAVSKSTLPKPVKTARHLAIIEGDLARMSRVGVATSEGVVPPPRWQDRHRHIIELHKAESDLADVWHEQQRYVVDYLGERPSLERMAALPDDPQYRRLAGRVNEAVDRAELAEKRLLDSRPFLAGLLSGAFVRAGERDYSRSYSDQVTAELAACARARLAEAPPSNVDACDPRPTEPEPVTGPELSPADPSMPPRTTR